jgi:hypothetical protein
LLFLLLGNQAAWASPLGYRYAASQPSYQIFGGGGNIVGYGSTPLAACSDLYKVTCL